MGGFFRQFPGLLGNYDKYLSSPTPESIDNAPWFVKAFQNEYREHHWI